MRRIFRTVAALAGLFLLAAAVSPLWPQTISAAKTTTGSSAEAIRAVNILRVINTAEVGTCRDDHGEAGDNMRFRPWARLVNAPCLKEAQSHFSGSRFAQAGKLSFSAAPEIVPGLMLRLVVSPDGKHYNAWLGPKPDVRCGFAFYSDERGVIYEGRAIGCSAQSVLGNQ